MGEMLEEFDRMVASLPARKNRLSFPDQCAAYAALRRGFPQSDTARAFGLSRGTISILANCRRTAAVHDRYLNVTLEYDKLGHDEFCARYLTDEIVSKILRFKMGAETVTDYIGRKMGPDPASRKYAWRLFPIEQMNGNIVQAFVGWRDSRVDYDINHDCELPAGWAWREAIEQEINFNAYISNADARWSVAREITSAKALDRAFTDYAQNPPSMEFKMRVLAAQKMEGAPP